MMKKLSINDITLFDLMAQDYDVWMTKNDDFGYNLEIDDENCEMRVRESELHPCAADSFAVFCRSFLACYDRASRKED